MKLLPKSICHYLNLFLAFIVFIFSVNPVLAIPSHRLARAPYLQNVMSDGSVFIHFKTKTACKTEVRYGKGLTDINQKAVDKIIRTSHEIKLTALEPNRRYFYQIIESDSRGVMIPAHKDFFSFIAPSPTDPVKEIKVWVLGDPGTAIAQDFQKYFKKTQVKVRDSLLEYEKTLPNLVFTLGDNVYPFGSEEYFDKAFFNIYQDIFYQVPLYTCYGNHDQGIEATGNIYAVSCPRPQGVYFDLFNLPTKGEGGGKPSGTEAYYSVEYGPAHFVVLDTIALDCNYKQMFDWLDKDLKAVTDGKWKIVMSHYPLKSQFFDQTKKNSKIAEISEYTFKTKMLELNDKFDVDLMISGHIHTYQRTFPIKDGRIRSHFAAKISEANTSRYDRHEGTIYMLAGTAGSAWTNSKLKHSSFTAKALGKPGALILKIRPESMTVNFLGDSGKVLDHLKIQNNERRI
jgi:predicted MPP superfamily phosphohydrolase